MNGGASAGDESASGLIDAKLAALGGWRAETLGRLRALIRKADPDVVETVKWRKISNPLGVPVWERDGIVCTGEIYLDKVKLTFARGGAVPDHPGGRGGEPSGESLEGRQIEKLTPQPQLDAAFGLRTTNWAPARSSTKAISEPLRKGRETGSTRAAWPAASMRRSSGSAVSTSSNRYWKPEQPPPSTATRSMTG